MAFLIMHIPQLMDLDQYDMTLLCSKHTSSYNQFPSKSCRLWPTKSVTTWEWSTILFMGIIGKELPECLAEQEEIAWELEATWTTTSLDQDGQTARSMILPLITTNTSTTGAWKNVNIYTKTLSLFQNFISNYFSVSDEDPTTTKSPQYPTTTEEPEDTTTTESPEDPPTTTVPPPTCADIWTQKSCINSRKSKCGCKNWNVAMNCLETCGFCEGGIRKHYILWFFYHSNYLSFGW